MRTRMRAHARAPIRTGMGDVGHLHVAARGGLAAHFLAELVRGLWQAMRAKACLTAVRASPT
eukprot:1281087-Alexandrium_andersonii.AAC.1